MFSHKLATVQCRCMHWRELTCRPYLMGTTRRPLLRSTIPMPHGLNTPMQDVAGQEWSLADSVVFMRPLGRVAAVLSMCPASSANFAVPGPRQALEQWPATSAAKRGRVTLRDHPAPGLRRAAGIEPAWERFEGPVGQVRHGTKPAKANLLVRRGKTGGLS